MSDLAKLFNDFDRGKLSRRQLLVALGAAVAIRPASAFAQGQCGGARAGTPDCDTTPAKLPFEPTGWKTVLLDHFSCQVADYPKEAAYYAALMNWKIRSDDGKQAVLDIGDWGGLVLRGGYQAPPSPPPSQAPAARAAQRSRPARSRCPNRRYPALPACHRRCESSSSSAPGNRPLPWRSRRSGRKSDRATPSSNPSSRTAVWPAWFHNQACLYWRRRIGLARVPWPASARRRFPGLATGVGAKSRRDRTH